MKKTNYIAALLLGVGLFCSCENSVEQPAKDVLAVVQSEYEAGNYNKAKQYLDKAWVYDAAVECGFSAVESPCKNTYHLDGYLNIVLRCRLSTFYI